MNLFKIIAMPWPGHSLLYPTSSFKLGFKIWCCSCSCCSYLCTFQFYDGMPADVVAGEKVSEKDLVKRVISDLVALFTGVNHVLYCDNFFTSGHVG